ncbi:MAG: ATP-binding cassette domain-containing protein [Clostridia bacterium]|nr:ATP-binding cassette domain-containing protein [Clostridia bacterium]
MKRGDVVLLSGESGSGKSTFLRLLKRGDINNRNCITLDNGETVDNLGNEYISFRPSINLGDESNVLSQITGKHNISDLDENEKQNLVKILKELDLDFPNLLEQLASKKFMEFSTGQQRRLALSKLFYRIDDGTSVIIVDEPVGNVEDRLIREQLKMIRQYAQEKNVMLLLTTHRLDLAEDLATKRYHINKEGVLEQVPVNKEQEKKDGGR